MILVAITTGCILIGSQALNCYSCTDQMTATNSGYKIESNCKDEHLVPCDEGSDRCVARIMILSELKDDGGYTVTDSMRRLCAKSAELDDSYAEYCSEVETIYKLEPVEGVTVSVECEEIICETDACNDVGHDWYN